MSLIKKYRELKDEEDVNEAMVGLDNKSFDLQLYVNKEVLKKCTPVWDHLVSSSEESSVKVGITPERKGILITSNPKHYILKGDLVSLKLVLF